jgi:hypothetical protein
MNVLILSPLLARVFFIIDVVDVAMVHVALSKALISGKKSL